MKVSLNLIRKYVDLPEGLTDEQIAYDMTLRTVEVEEVENTAKKFHDIVVGEILEIKAHPNADKLRICMVDIGEEEPEGNYLEFYKMLGIEKEQLIHIEKPARFQKVFVPEAGFRPCIWYTEEYQRMFDLMTESVLKDKTLKEKFKNIKKIYFSRRKFGKAAATEFGEEYIEQCFNQNGYESLGPETLTLREQIYVWNHAEAIACMNGTIPLNVVFCKNEKLKLTILNKMSIYHKNPYIYLYMRNIQAEFIDIYKEPLKGYPKSLGEGPYLIKTGKEFFHYCQREKFEIPYTGMKLKFYDLKQEIRYYLCVIGIGNKIRRVGSYIKRKMLRR